MPRNSISAAGPFYNDALTVHRAARRLRRAGARGGCRARCRRPRAAQPGSLGGLQSDLAGQMRLAGPHSSAYVYDLTTKQALFSQRATRAAPPASVEKLYTATTALERLGPDRPPADDGPRRRPARPGRRLGRRPLPARRRRPDVRRQRVHPQPLRRRRRERLDARRPARPHRRHPRDHADRSYGDESLLRLAARRALEQLRARPVPRRHARGARLRPRRERPRTRRARAGRLRRAQAVGDAEGRRRQHPAARAAPRPRRAGAVQLARSARRRSRTARS